MALAGTGDVVAWDLKAPWLCVLQRTSSVAELFASAYTDWEVGVCLCAAADIMGHGSACVHASWWRCGTGC